MSKKRALRCFGNDLSYDYNQLQCKIADKARDSFARSVLRGVRRIYRPINEQTLSLMPNSLYRELDMLTGKNYEKFIGKKRR